MEITTDISLKGGLWRKALASLEPFFPQSLQPIYSIFVISMSIGIMYDKQKEMAGEETPEDKDNRPNVPRTVLHQHSTDLDFLFQSAVLTSKVIELSEKDRMDLAFNAISEIKFNRLAFLTEFANFGVEKLLEKTGDDPIESMEKIKSFLASTVEGYNYEIDSIADEDLDEEDL